MRLIFVLYLVCLFAVISALKHSETNADPVEAETIEHGSKKYTKDYQKSHHQSHKHKKNSPQEKHVRESKPEKLSAGAPDPVEAELQADVVTSRKEVEAKRRRDQAKDLHLQDLVLEEQLQKRSGGKKNKRGHHHGMHQAEVEEIPREKESKLFEQEPKAQAAEKVIEDNFAPLKESKGNKKNRAGDKKGQKDKNNKHKNLKNKEKKSKNNKHKNGKNKDKKNKKW